MATGAPPAQSALQTFRETRVGGVVTLAVEPGLEAAAALAYETEIAKLDAFAFWQAATADNYRPEPGLWFPQQRAVAFAQAYLVARRAGDPRAQSEAALIKMPTGTGKTAVIATLACAVPDIARTLIITPRKGLVDQMRRDLSYRFWERLGATYEGHAIQEEASDADRARVRAAVEAGTSKPVRVLDAGQYKAIWDERAAPRQILVSTFNALHLALGIAPPAHRDFHGREPRAPAGSISSLDPNRSAAENRQLFADLLKAVDLVIVDEGHYEPAMSWAQAVRALGRPTLIFSATPYRNDYKYFNINGNFVFNLPWQEAVDRQLVRDVQMAAPLTIPAGVAAAGPLSGAAGFVAACQPALVDLPAGKRAIVHAASFERLVDLQRAFAGAGEEVVLIHDAHRAGKDADLVALPDAERAAVDALRFRHVRDAEQSQAANGARVWLHQFKLLEGIDDSRFVEVWLHDPLQSARQFIQQVGRIIRRPDLTDPTGQSATVRGSAQPIAASQGSMTVAAQAEARWADYLAYESYIAGQAASAFIAETQLLATVKRTAPAIQYVAREFRRGHLLDEAPDMAAFLLPRRATICRVDGVAAHQDGAIDDATLDRIAAAAREAMEVEERFDILPVAALPGQDYRDLRLFRYLFWQNSPYLAAHHLPEWRLGLMAIARAGRYLFLLDTETLCIDTTRLGLVEPGADELKRLFPAGGARIVETSASGLDIGEFGLRSLTVRKHRLDQGYFDLAEASQVPTVVRGYGPLAGIHARRRLSLGRASVADAAYANLPLKEWTLWTRQVADMLADEGVTRHRYFGRFAAEQKPLKPPDAVPKSILLDLWDMLEPSEEVFAARDWDAEAARTLLEADSFCAVRTLGTAAKPKYEFSFAGHKVRIEYLYRDTVPAAGRYRLSSEGLNEAVRIKDGPAEQAEEAADLDGTLFGGRRPATLLGLLNQEQSFRVIPAKPKAVYTHGSFYTPKVDAELFSLLEPSNLLGPVVSEKGDTRITAAADWDTRTLFGLVWGWMGGAPTQGEAFAEDMQACDIMICDDSTRETADFYGIDDANHRVLVVHAKADKGPASARARKLQEVGRQAQTSLAFAGSSGEAFAYPKDWEKDWSVVLASAAGTPTITKPRLLKGPPGLTIKQAHGRLAAAIASPRYRKHVVVQTAGLLSKDSAERTLTSTAQASRQFLYYLASLRTGFDRAGVALRIICDP